MEKLDSSGSFASITVDSDHSESEELMPVKLSATSTPAMTPSLCSELRISLVKLNYLADKSAKSIIGHKEQLFISRMKLIFKSTFIINLSSLPILTSLPVFSHLTKKVFLSKKS